MTQLSQQTVTSRNPIKKSVIVLSSHVARGSIGNRAAVFALETLGHPVWAIPTILLAWHPGHGKATGITPPDEKFAALLDDLLNSDWIDEIGAVLTGYMASAEQALAVSDFILKLRKKNPQITFLCDPVIGDKGQLYVQKDTAITIRDRLVSIADIVTPNLFELGWLTGLKVNNATQALAAAKAYGDKTILITSVPGMMQNCIGNLLVQQQEALFAEHRHIDGPPNGAGDLTAALFLSYMLEHTPLNTALQRTTASVFEIIARSAQSGADELVLESNSQSILKPMAMVQTRNLATASKISKPQKTP